MSVANFYCNSDPYAPALGNSWYAIASLLRKCLCDGYGSSAPAGWTCEWWDETNEVAVFRIPVSSQFFLRIAGYAENSYMRVVYTSIYQAMGDQNTGSGRRPADETKSILLGIGEDTPYWFIVADSRSFWFGCGGDHSGCTFFGELDSIVPNDLYSFSFPGGDAVGPTGDTPDDAPLLDFSYPGLYYPLYAYDSAFSATGDSISLTYRRPGGAVNSNRTLVGQTDGSPPYPYLGGALLYSRVPIIETGHIDRFRGFMPGLLELQHERIDLLSLIPSDRGYALQTLGNKQLVLVKSFWGSVIAIDLNKYRILEGS